MFKYSFKKLVVRNNALSIETPSKKEIHVSVLNLLKSYEDMVYAELAKHNDFKYVQSTVGAFSLFNNLKKTVASSINIEMMTRHPNFVGGILINNLIPSCYSGKETFALYFKGDFGACWLNSQAKSENLISEIKKLLSVSFLKKDIELNLIEVFGSDKLIFTETQPGTKSKRWSIKINL